MSDEKTAPLPDAPVSEEFFIRVNDFIAMANRIERRFDTRHAQSALLHAVARYSSHHYRTTVSADSLAEREDFARYIGSVVSQLVMGHLADVAGAVPADAPVSRDAAGIGEQDKLPDGADGSE